MRFKKYRLKAPQKVKLAQWDPNDTSEFSGKKEDGLNELQSLRQKLDGLQEKLYADHKHKFLIVLQGMDTSGKDATIRRVFEGVNPQGVRVARFGPPTPEEAEHDFLWRIHKEVPRNGEIVIFNRSHYEGVLVGRVHKLVPQEIWYHRYSEINEFEKMLDREGTTILKFYLNIDSDEQKKRLQERLEDPTKHWKFSVNDLPEREHWPEYMAAYEDVLEETATKFAPWYVVPSNHGWFRDLVVCSVVSDTLEGLNLQFPSLPREMRHTKIV